MPLILSGRSTLLRTACEVAALFTASTVGTVAVAEAASPVWSPVIESLGVPLTLVVFFLYQNWNREKRAEEEKKEAAQHAKETLDEAAALAREAQN